MQKVNVKMETAVEISELTVSSASPDLQASKTCERNAEMSSGDPP